MDNKPEIQDNEFPGSWPIKLASLLSKAHSYLRIYKYDFDFFNVIEWTMRFSDLGLKFFECFILCSFLYTPTEVKMKTDRPTTGKMK